MKKETIVPNIYSKLREIRRSRGLTVNKLAEKMGENYQKIGRLERGKSNLTIDYLIKISEALNTSIDSLLHNDSQSKVSEGCSKENLSLLTKLVTLVEEHYKTIASEDNAENKAKFISFLYSQALKFREEQQKLFLDVFFESMLALKKR